MTAAGTFELVLVLLAGALALSSLAARTALPPAAALVVGGMVLAVTPGVPSLDLDPDLILVLFLPPLLMSSAYNTAWRDFRAEMVPILLMAVGAVAFTTFCVGWVVHMVAPGLPLAACFTLGAIVSPPDAVAAAAVLQRLHLPRRLTTILEGESLVNDASGLVLYRFAVAAAMTGAFSPAHALGSFVWLAVGGIALGLLWTFVMIELLRRMRQTDLTIAMTFIATWGVYILAERVGASGVLAVVTAGITFGILQHETLDAGTRMETGAVWKFVTYVLEAFVFVLIGLALRGVLERRDGSALAETVPIAAAAIAVVILSRLVWVTLVAGLPFFLPRRLRREGVKASFVPPLVVGWAGMRGVVTLAVALALPETFPGRDPILLAAFAVILFTVLVQGTTLGPLIRFARLDMLEDEHHEAMDEAAARAAAVLAGMQAVEAMAGADGPLHPQLLEDYRIRSRATARLRDDPDSIALIRSEHFAAALTATAASRAALIRLHRRGDIHDSVMTLLEEEYDLEEMRLRRLGKLAATAPKPRPWVCAIKPGVCLPALPIEPVGIKAAE